MDLSDDITDTGVQGLSKLKNTLDDFFVGDVPEPIRDKFDVVTENQAVSSFIIYLAFKELDETQVCNIAQESIEFLKELRKERGRK